MTTKSTDLPPAEVEGGLTSEPETISIVFSKLRKDWTEDDMKRMVTRLRALRVDLDNKPEKKAKAPSVPKEELKGLSGKDLLARLGRKAG